MLYQITGNGLERVPKNKIVPVVGMVVYMGSSSSPDRAIVTGVENGIITYRKYPYVKDIRNDFDTFCMSASAGCRTQIENLK